jgi:predicted acylesterase/phospholipase RssA
MKIDLPRRRRPATAAHPDPERFGLVCAGGGVTGAIYEIGVLAALEDRLEGISLNDFDVFVGVSCGSYISALLANGVTPGLLYRNVTRSARSRTDLDDLGLFRLNLGEIADRLAHAPLTVLEAAWDYYQNRHETTLTDLVTSLGQLLPSGIFRNDGLETWLTDWLSRDGRTNDFRKLQKVLRIVAVELDTGETTAFGENGTGAVPIARAVAASCAIPGLYRPVRIEGREFIDGGVRKTAHISLALEEGCGLVVCVNPIVPIRYGPEVHSLPILNGRPGALSSRGMPTILEQVFRVTLHSRMRYGIARYRRENPDSNIVVFEPRPEDLPRFMRNIMRTSGRIRIAEFAYHSAMQTIDADFKRLSRLFAHHGIRLRPAAPERMGWISTIDARLDAEDTPTRLAASLHVLERKLKDAEAAQARRQGARV